LRLGIQQRDDRRAPATIALHARVLGRRGAGRCVVCGRQGWTAVVRGMDRRTRRGARPSLPFRPLRDVRSPSPP
jgi:hypothetical protein